MVVCIAIARGDLPLKKIKILSRVKLLHVYVSASVSLSFLALTLHFMEGVAMKPNNYMYSVSQRSSSMLNMYQVSYLVHCFQTSSKKFMF